MRVFNDGAAAVAREGRTGPIKKRQLLAGDDEEGKKKNYKPELPTFHSHLPSAVVVALSREGDKRYRKEKGNFGFFFFCMWGQF